MTDGPLISVLTPVYRPSPEVLSDTIASVVAQGYQRWELCLVDDHSQDEAVREVLERAMVSDPRIRVVFRTTNGGIVAASNDALELCTGEVVALLDHDDLLHPDALDRVATAFAADDELDYLYTDEDVVDPEGRRIAPFFKPDWSPERFRGQMYCCHLSAIRRSLMVEVGGFRDGFDGSQDWDLVLRVTERARRIAHVPEVLYHWRTVPTSVLAGDHVKPYAYDSARRAVEEHCRRVGIDADVVELERRGHFRVVRRLSHPPMVSVIIPTRGSVGVAWGMRRCMVVEAVRSLVERSTANRWELILVADTDTPAEVLARCADLAGDRLRLVDYDEPFDFSDKCNRGALAAEGDVLVFLNDDVEVITGDWMETLCGFLAESDVGAAGAHLLFDDGRLQHAGHVHLGGNPGHLMYGRSAQEDLNRLALWLDREVAGVSAACLAIRRQVFQEVGGFSRRFPNNYNDVDLCLRLRQAGYRIVVSPHVRLYHFESVTRDPTVDTEEIELLRARWGRELSADPFYSPNYGTWSDAFPEPINYP